MSVFTPLEHTELEAFLQLYPLGKLLAFSATPDGTENTNYFVSLEGGECVLTLIERGNPEELPFFIALLDRLHRAGLEVPYAIPSCQGQSLGTLAGKPALLQPKLAGKHLRTPNAHQCAEVGRWLAKLHRTTTHAPILHPMDRGLDWMLREGLALAPTLTDEQQQVLHNTLEEVQRLKATWEQLPQANLHADLFRDNALFTGNHLSGVIDFYSACSGPMLYDLAIVVNDWCVCSEETGALESERTSALLQAYAALRPFSMAEIIAWPLVLQIACLRFWISRLLAARQHAGKDVLIKDPEAFYQRLLARKHSPAPTLPLAF